MIASKYLKRFYLEHNLFFKNLLIGFILIQILACSSDNEIKKVSPVSVYAESTPNPNAMKFVVNKKIVDDIFEFKSVEETLESPLAKSLFSFPLVKEVFFDFNFVSIIKKIEFNWEENVMEIREFIRSFIQDGNTIVFEENIKKVKAKKNNIKIDNVSKEIIKIIDGKILC